MQLRAILGAVIALAIGVAVLAARPVSYAGSTVKLMMGDGHCSGAHLGAGLILTAEHCTRDGDITITTDKDGTMPSVVLWANKSYDVALLQGEDRAPPIDASQIKCAMPSVGTKIIVSGSPFNMNFIKTRGEIVSGIIKMDNYWDEVVVANVTVGGGNSGGPVLDVSGHIIGILVGGYLPAPTFSIIVPSPTVCRLLGRG